MYGSSQNPFVECTLDSQFILGWIHVDSHYRGPNWSLTAIVMKSICCASYGLVDVTNDFSMKQASLSDEAWSQSQLWKGFVSDINNLKRV